jgi:hypothetical protein
MKTTLHIVGAYGGYHVCLAPWIMGERFPATIYSVDWEPGTPEAAIEAKARAQRYARAVVLAAPTEYQLEDCGYCRGQRKEDR